MACSFLKEWISLENGENNIDMKDFKATYGRRTVWETVEKGGGFDAGGCHSYMAFNGGNVNITLADVFVLRPGQSFSSPDENPDIIDTSHIAVQFDMANNPKVVAADTGSKPQERIYDAAAPPPVRDTRLIIVKSFLYRIE